MTCCERRGTLPLARKDLGHTTSIMVKLHPELKAYVERSAAEAYCTVAQYVRQLIVDDKRRNDAGADEPPTQAANDEQAVAADAPSRARHTGLEG